MGNSLERQANCRGGEIGRPPVYKREMVFESLKSTEVDEYGTIAGSSPALGTIKKLKKFGGLKNIRIFAPILNI